MCSSFWNDRRIWYSIFVLELLYQYCFFCITTVCIIFNVVLYKLIKKTDDKRIHAAYIMAVILFMLFGIWEQNPHIDIPYIHNYEQWTSDDNFVKSMENDVEEYT